MLEKLLLAVSLTFTLSVFTEIGTPSPQIIDGERNVQIFSIRASNLKNN